ncbi:MAG: hypothetical protein ACJAS1_003442 [Oleiphilaceae bacterium]|jgi:hypothetical protein
MNNAEKSKEKMQILLIEQRKTLIECNHRPRSALICRTLDLIIVSINLNNIEF